MKKITINKVIELTLFMYILSLFFLTQQQGLNLISNGIALVLISFIWIDLLLKNKKIRFNDFSIVYLVFIFICIFSVFYAVDSNTALVKSRTLILNFGLMFSLMNYIDSVKKINKILYLFIGSSFLTSLYILFISDFSNVTRMGSELGNVNAIGMLITLSTVFCFYFILEDKSSRLLLVSITNIIAILLTGSRKSLLFLLISIILILFFTSKRSIKKKIKYLLIGFVLATLLLYLVYNVPIFYQIIGRRMENLIEVILGEGVAERSLNTRNYMIKLGVDWFKDRPLVGYGIDNYRFLLNNRVGMFTYSHNNIIELLVGVGVLGTLVYYYSQLIILKNLSRVSSYKSNYKLGYLFISVIIGYIIISVSLIYYDNKAFNIILAVSSVLPSVYFKESNIDISLMEQEVYYEQID